MRDKIKAGITDRLGIYRPLTVWEWMGIMWRDNASVNLLMQNTLMPLDPYLISNSLFYLCMWTCSPVKAHPYISNLMNLKMRLRCCFALLRGKRHPRQNQLSQRIRWHFHNIEQPVGENVTFSISYNSWPEHQQRRCRKEKRWEAEHADSTERWLNIDHLLVESVCKSNGMNLQKICVYI